MPPKKKGKKKKKNGEYDPNDSEDEEIKTADEHFSKSGYDSDGEMKDPAIYFLAKQCHYAVIKEVGKLFLEYHLTKKAKSDWDVAWFDYPVPD